MELPPRIELGLSAYQAEVLPLNYGSVDGPTRVELANLRLEVAARSVARADTALAVPSASSALVLALGIEPSPPANLAVNRL